MRVLRQGELFGEVIENFGYCRFMVLCHDGVERVCRLPGRLRKRRLRIRISDIVIVKPWDVDQQRADIIFRYKNKDVSFLRECGDLDFTQK